MEKEKSRLIISFSDRTPSFTYGVEFGRLLEKMERGDSIIMNNGFPIRHENIEVIKQSCRQYGYIPFFDDKILDGWVGFTGLKKIVSN